MAQIYKGILGGFSGKVGPVVGGSWRGKAYMRSMPTPKKGVASAAQQLQRSKFSMVNKLLRPLHEVLQQTFPEQGSSTGYGRAVSYHLKNALVTNGTAWEVDYAQVRVAEGVHPGVELQGTPVVNNGQLQLQWHNNAGLGKAAPDDLVLLVFICSNNLQLSGFVWGEAERSTQQLTLSVTQFKGQSLHVYMALSSTNGKAISNSTYLGKFDIV